MIQLILTLVRLSLGGGSNYDTAYLDACSKGYLSGGGGVIMIQLILTPVIEAILRGGGGGGVIWYSVSLGPQ